MLSYGDIEWGSNSVNVGFNSGNTSYILPAPIQNFSNVDFPGLYVYRVDQESLRYPSQRFRICQGNDQRQIKIGSQENFPLIVGNSTQGWGWMLQSKPSYQNQGSPPVISS